MNDCLYAKLSIGNYGIAIVIGSDEQVSVSQCNLFSTSLRTPFLSPGRTKGQTCLFQHTGPVGERAARESYR